MLTKEEIKKEVLKDLENVKIPIFSSNVGVIITPTDIYILLIRPKLNIERIFTNTTKFQIEEIKLSHDKNLLQLKIKTATGSIEKINYFL